MGTLDAGYVIILLGVLFSGVLIMFFLKNIIKLLRDNIFWIALSVGIFAAGAVFSIPAIFAGFDMVEVIIEEQFEALEELGERVFEGTWWEGTFFIFLNNLQVSLFLMISGILVGLPTLLGTLLNGALMGSIITFFMVEEMPVLPFLVLGILPHGIIELPAFFISTAFGFKLGYHFLFPLQDTGRFKSVGIIIKEYIILLPLVVLLLLAASFVEILVTPQLLGLVESVYDVEIPKL